MKLRHKYGNSIAFNWLWWAAAGGAGSGLYLILSNYLIQLANPWPIIGVVFFGFAMRARGMLAGDVHDRAGKTIFLLALTSILAVWLAMQTRPFFVEIVQELGKGLEKPTHGLDWARDYIEPFRVKVVGYVGFYIAGYMIAYKTIAFGGNFIPLLAYPRSKAELHAAFWEAAQQTAGVPRHQPPG